MIMQQNIPGYLSKLLLTVILLIASANQLSAAPVEYQLTVDYAQVDVEGAEGLGMLINGQYPAPTLYFNEGDFARITVHNNMDVPSSIHWHGLLVPASEDGVPYLSRLPIAPGEAYTYQFEIKHNGTYWYHSHVGLQEQQGLHGAIVIKPKHLTAADLANATEHEAVLVLQDWTRENPDQVLANLKKDGDYYALKKDSVLSLWGYWKKRALKNWWQAQWTRMGGMDVSDIGYDAFLINGKNSQMLFENLPAGEKVRLRIVNAGASTYFYLHSAEGLRWEIIANDGQNVQAVSPKEIFHSPAETYDLLVTIPDGGAYELRASTQDGTGFASVFIGSGEKQFAEARPKPDLYQSHDNHNAHSDHSDTAINNEKNTENEHAAHATPAIAEDPHAFHKMDAKPVSLLGASSKPEWSYRLLKSDQPSTLPEGNIRDVELRLTGDMRTYNWSFNDVPLSAADKIKIKRGEVVRFHFINETMMDHPLHLHGHFFRVLVGNGEYDPLKHTLNVAPFEKISIEFYANEEKDWFFHCHNLYHHKAGMARVISYEDSDVDDMFLKHHARDEFYYAGNIKLLNDYAMVDAAYFNSRMGLELEAKSYDYEYEKVELVYFYRATQWLNFLAAVEADEFEEEFKIGFSYVLPLLIDANFYWKDNNKFEVELGMEIQLTKRIQAHLAHSSSEAYHYGLEYRFNEQWSAEVSKTDIVDASAGINFRF